MPGPTTERLDADFRVMREDFQDLKVILARMDAKLGALDDFKSDVKTTLENLKADSKANYEELRDKAKDYHDSLRFEIRSDFEEIRADLKVNTVSIGKLDIRISKLDEFTNNLKWVIATFGLACVYGVVSVTGRLTALETQMKSVDGRLGGVETQMKVVTERLGVVEVGLKGVQTDLSEVKGAIDRRAPDTSLELDDRIRRIARSVVDEAARQASAVKP